MPDDLEVYMMHVFFQTLLYMQKLLLQGHARNIDGKSVPLFLVGDSGYHEVVAKAFSFQWRFVYSYENI